jgi:hypothetical protein
MHIERVAETGFRPPELDLISTPPPMFNWIWEIFTLLSCARQHNNGSPQPIPMTEIKAYYDLIDEKPLRYEVALLRRLDVAALNITHELRQQQ